MSRVYSALTGAARPTTPTLEAPDDGVWHNDEDTPFIEIGGPAGPIFSASMSPIIVKPSQAKPVNPKPTDVKPVAEAIVPPKPVASPTASGPLSGSLKSEPKLKVESSPEPQRDYPRLAPVPAATTSIPSPALLSVRFHDVLARNNRKHADAPDYSLVALHLPDHPVSGEYRVLRDEIRRQLPDATPRVLLFSAAAPEAGTTTVLLNFAITLANEGKSRVLVVDGNVNRPAVAAKLALRAAPGLCEVLSQQVPLTWAVQSTSVTNLQVLTAGEPTQATSAAMASDFPKLLTQLRQWYDWVLADAGVWGSMAERDAACPAADAVYLVTRDSDVNRPEFTSLRGGVKELGGLLRGYIATRV